MVASQVLIPSLDILAHLGSPQRIDAEPPKLRFWSKQPDTSHWAAMLYGFRLQIRRELLLNDIK